MRQTRGFTLIELLVAMAIIMIVFMVSMPVFGPILRNKDMDAATQSISTAFMKARSLAMRHNAVYYIGFDTRSPKENMLCILTTPPIAAGNYLTDVVDTPIVLPLGIKFLSITSLMYSNDTTGFNVLLAAEGASPCLNLKAAASPFLYYAFNSMGQAVRSYRDGTTYDKTPFLGSNDDEYLAFGDDDFDVTKKTQYEYKVMKINLMTGSVQTVYTHHRE